MFRNVTLRLGLALIVLAVAAYPVMAAKSTFVATMNGGNEIPARDTSAAGFARFVLSADGTEIAYKLIVANIVDVTQAHIHCGPPDLNGPVVAFLYGFGPTVSPDGILAQGTITAANVVAVGDSPACPGGVATLADLVAKIQNGGAYANVHTVALPGGEVRGQIR